MKPGLPDFSGETGLMSAVDPGVSGITGVTGLTGDTPSTIDDCGKEFPKVAVE